MKVDTEANGIPPKGSGRPRSDTSRRIEDLEVGERAAFRASRKNTVSGLAFYWGQKLGRLPTEG